MSDQSQITFWIGKLKSGDDEAAARVWDQFFHRVRALAEKKLGSLPRRTYDAEDLALSAINALCVGAREDRFRCLETGRDLWQLLAMITVRKAANVWQKQARAHEVGESVLGKPMEGNVDGLAQVPTGNAGDLFDAIDDVCVDLLGLLDDRLREVALLRLQGYANEEIAEYIGRSVKSVERYLKLIRDRWESSRPE